MTVISWIGSQANRIAIALRAFFYMGSLLKWWELTEDQLMAIGACVESFLAVFVESNIVTKVRMRERMDEKDAKIEEKVADKVEARVAHITAAAVADEGRM